MSVEFLTITEREKFQYCPTPPPTPPFHDWRWWSLVIPSLATAFGLFLFGIFAVGFTQLRQLPEDVKFVVVALGAICIPFGSELGTVSSVIEIFRKHFGPTGSTAFDWIGFVTSTCTSITAVVLSWAYLLSSDTAWSNDVKTWGPLVFGALMVLDFTFSLLETGAYLGSYDKRFHEWYKNDFTPWIRRKEKRLDSTPASTYNEYRDAESHWADEPPVKSDDTPTQGIPTSELAGIMLPRHDTFPGLDVLITTGSGMPFVGIDPSDGRDKSAVAIMSRDDDGHVEVKNAFYDVPTHKLDSGEVKIEDIEHLHPAVARAILSDD